MAKSHPMFEEEIESDILRQLTTPKMEMPDEKEFEGSLNEEQLKEMTPDNKLIMLGISSLGKRIDFVMKWVYEMNRHTRLNEAETIRRRIHIDDTLDEIKWKVKVASWIGSGVGAGILLELGIKIVDAHLK